MILLNTRELTQENGKIVHMMATRPKCFDRVETAMPPSSNWQQMASAYQHRATDTDRWIDDETVSRLIVSALST